MEVREAFEKSLKAAGHLGETHQAAIELGRILAERLDYGDTECASKFLSVLRALGLTVNAPKAAKQKGGDGESAASPLDELRARRLARQNRATDMDTSAS